MKNPTHRPEKKEKKIPRIPKVIGELAEKIVGKLYTPPPMSPKLLEQEKKRIMPLLEQFLDEQLSKKEEEVLRKFVSFCKHWIRGHKKDDWHPILMDSFEAFLENRKEEFTNWEFEETVRIVELKTQTKK